MCLEECEKAGPRPGQQWFPGMLLIRASEGQLSLTVRYSSWVRELSGYTEPLVGEVGPTSCALCRAMWFHSSCDMLTELGRY